MSGYPIIYACRGVGVAIAFVAISNTSVSAQQEISMPTFAACAPAEAPSPPERWRAVGLMIPFVRQQLDVGEFIYDSTLPFAGQKLRRA